MCVLFFIIYNFLLVKYLIHDFIELDYELVQEGQLEVNQQLDYIERSLDSLNKEFNKYRGKKKKYFFRNF